MIFVHKMKWFANAPGTLINPALIERVDGGYTGSVILFASGRTMRVTESPAEIRRLSEGRSA